MTTNQKIVFDDAVLAKIAGKTASEVDGVLSLQGNLIDDLSNRLRDEVPPTTGVNVDLDADQRAVSIELTVVLAYGKDANAIFNRIAKKITEAVEEMTGYHVKDLKLTVKDMLTAAEWQAKQADKHPEPEPPKPPEPKPEPETKPDPAPDPPKPDSAPEPPKPDAEPKPEPDEP